VVAYPEVVPRIGMLSVRQSALLPNPRCYSLELECGWCGRVIDVRELERIEQKKMRVTLKLWFWR
jgi:hypothetical protein